MISNPRLLALSLLSLAALSGCESGGGAMPAPTVRFDGAMASSQCVVTFSMGAGQIASTADILADYSQVTGSFGTDHHGTHCRSLVPESTFDQSVNECEDADCMQGTRRTLHMELVMGQSDDSLVLDGPAPLYECLFEGNGSTLTQMTGEVHLMDGSLPVEVDVRCDGWPDSTTTTSTSTTTDTICSGGECHEGDVISLQYWLDDAVQLDALQINTDFASAIGKFAQVSSQEVRCTLAPDVHALFATNQRTLGSLSGETSSCTDCDTRFVAGFAFGDVEIHGPIRLMSCDFVVGSQTPAAGDLTLEVVDATDLGNEVFPRPRVSVRGLP